MKSLTLEFMASPPAPTLTISPEVVTAGGTWQVHALARSQTVKAVQASLRQVRGKAIRWDLTRIDALDHIGAQMLWNAWDKRRPTQLALADGHDEFFKRLEDASKL